MKYTFFDEIYLVLTEPARLEAGDMRLEKLHLRKMRNVIFPATRLRLVGFPYIQYLF